MRKYLYILFFVLAGVRLFAVPATPKTIIHQTPDGKSVELILHGDEYFHYYTTTSGLRVEIGKDGSITHYPAFSKAEIAEAQQRSPMRKIKQQFVKRNFPTKGAQKSLVILAEFADVKFSIAQPREAFFEMLNEQGYSKNGATGSARDYYVSSSDGQFTPEFVTVGPYSLPHDMNYYGENEGNWDRSSRLMQFCRDAVAAADADIDFAEYDTDNDGYIDNVFIYYAGYAESEGGPLNSIWPHQYAVNPEMVIGTSMFDGKMIGSYACTSELKGYTGTTMCGIGTFCHEFGHVLGLPDYYHTESSSITALGHWDIMDKGSYLNEGRTPPTHSALNRFTLGWISLTQIDQPTTLELTALSEPKQTGVSQAFLIANAKHNMDFWAPNINEYFIVEYRKKTNWDAFLPDYGLLVWHIDYQASAWADNTVNNVSTNTQSAGSHLRVYIENPQGNRTISSPGAFHAEDYFLPILWNGDTIKQDVSGVTPTADGCKFDFMGGGLDRSAPIALQPNVLAYNSMQAVWNKKRTNAEVTYLLTAFTLAGGDTAYVVRRKEVKDTTFLLSNLRQQTIYTYYVTAYVYNENQAVESFRSNIIKATTPAEHSAKKLAVAIVGSTVYVTKPNANDELQIYDEYGKLIYTKKTSDNIVSLDGALLSHGHLYVIKAGSKHTKIIY